VGNPCNGGNRPKAPQPAGNLDESRDTKEQGGREPLNVEWQKGTIMPRVAKHFTEKKAKHGYADHLLLLHHWTSP